VVPATPVPDFHVILTQGVFVSNETITDLRVRVDMTHGWVGDLSMRLTHESTGTWAEILNRPGYPMTPFGCNGDDIDVTLFDTAAGGPVESACEPTLVPAISGMRTPLNPLSVFDGESLSGVWSLTVTDHELGVAGTINRWCLSEPSGTGSTNTPAIGGWGVASLIVLFLVTSAFYVRRRGTG
jgi:hypothetical protein